MSETASAELLSSSPAVDSGAAAGLSIAAGSRITVSDLLPALVADGLIDAADADETGRYTQLLRSDQHALVSLAHRKLRSPATGRILDLDTLCTWLAGKAGLPCVRIDPLKVDLSRVADVMSSQYATRFKILPIDARSGEVTIATAEPWAIGWVDELRSLLRRDVKLVFANPVEINRYIVEFFTLARTVRDAQKKGGAAAQNNFEQLVELGRSGKNVDANDRHVVTIVDWLWQYAFEQRASDIHLEPRRDMGAIRFRIDGVLHNVYQVPVSVLAAMTSRIKLLGRMDVVERRRPQDGRVKTRNTDGREVELRLATMPTAFGEKMVMRIFDPDVLVRDFAELGFSDDERARWDAMIARPNGIVLVTGPTGSGKTTTLYTTLKLLATEEVNVCTVEDPIEMVEPSFNQMQVQAQQGLELGFAEGVRALMRQDPDIIMVGEIRDLETAEMAVQAALTGHLVLSTLHTNDAPSAISRLLDLGVPPYLLKSTLVGVMAQRLARTLCAHCKQEAEPPSDEAWRELIAPFRAPRPQRGWRAVGCMECRMSGFRGRTGLYELLTMDEPLRALVNDHPDLDAIRRRAMQGHLRPLRLAGAQKVAAGLTTVDEVLKVAPPIGG